MMIHLHTLKHYHLHVDKVRQNRNVHDYLADLDSEVPLYMKVELLNHHSSFSLEIVTVLLCLPHITGRPACQLSLQLDSSSFLRAFVASTDGLLGSKAFANLTPLFWRGCANLNLTTLIWQGCASLIPFSGSRF